MKAKDKLFTGKYLRIIIIAAVILVMGMVGLTVRTILKSQKEFYQGGYVLVPPTEENITTNVNEQYYFEAGTKYKNKYGEIIIFKDTSNDEVSVSTEQFVHYEDGSLGAFTKGVVMDLVDVGEEQVKYYGVSDKTIITKEGSSYEMSYLNNSLVMNEFIWKISDDAYMVVSPEVTLRLNNNTEIVLEDYAQVQYVAGGIARVVHQDGTYQTVSDDAYIKTDAGLELKLTSRCFFKDGVESVSLDTMVIDSSSNLVVDENEDKVKLPTFRVVNGKNGADGEDGADGESGFEGETGADGGEGSSGNEGQDGYDGLEGDGGEWGYDGKDGIAGEDAENAGVQDGIASIEQQKAPIVKLETDKYTLGPNSVTMNLVIDDPKGMLDGDMTWTIYSRDDMKVHNTGTIPQGVTGQVITSSNLVPATEYVLVVSGEYTNEGYTFETDFFTKIFETDSIGLGIEKVQVTDTSIVVKTIKDDSSKVGTYKIGLYIGEESTTNVGMYTFDYADGREFVFDKDNGMVDGVEITPDTDYVLRLYDVTDEVTGSLISANVTQKVTTLKRTPYYEVETNGEVVKRYIPQTLTRTITSSRYKTVAVSIDTSLCDLDNGITGYRYELFETSTLTGDVNNAVPTQVKETEDMETVNFKIDPEKNYIARVVVLFNDNEKNIEIASQTTQPFKLEQTSYPSVSFVNVVNKYDSVSGYIMVEDTSVGHEMLLGHVNKDYPLVLTITSQLGDPFTINLYETITPPDGSKTSDHIQYYYFSQDGLSRGTPYSLTVSGYVNESGQEWNTLIRTDEDGDGVPDGVEKNCFQYIAGKNFNSGDPTPIVVKAMSQQNAGSNLFMVNVGFTSGVDANGNPVDASYEVGNMEKVTFSLINKNTGVTLGTFANVVDTYVDENGYDPKHDSIFLKEAYSPNGAVQVYSDALVLTDASFGVEGDSRIAAGGTFQIRMEYASDYTQRTEYNAYTNNLEIDESSYIVPENKVIYEFVVEQRHVQVADPNGTVTVDKIQNQDMEVINPDLDDDTVVGLKIDSGYTVNDATSIIYYIYEVTSNSYEPIIVDNATDFLTNNKWRKDTDNDGIVDGDIIQPIAVKTIKLTNSTSEGKTVEPWTVYFNDLDEDSVTSNLSDPDANGNRTTIFKRGKLYFVRYEIVTDGRLQDVNEGDIYPNCVYVTIYNDVNDYPFYRSNVFSLERQKPSIQRYLWDTTTSGTTSSHEWKYKIYDPDRAILTYFSSVKADVRAVVNQYADFEKAAADEDAMSLLSVSLTDLYGAGNDFKNVYSSLNVDGLTNGKWYTLSIPYCLYGANTRVEYLGDVLDENIQKEELEKNNKKTLLSVPSKIHSVSQLNTSVLGNVSNPTHPNDASDYAVNGVVVKGVSTESGIGDDYGYRIKLTLQGSEIERIAGVRVTVTGKDDNGATKTVIYDPVNVVLADGVVGTKSNNYGFAYLEYEPIVAAGIENRSTNIKVEAYYTTYQAGIKSFDEYIGIDHKKGYTSDGFRFANNNAWAIKQYSYNITDGAMLYEYSYQRITDELGTFIPSADMIKNLSDKKNITKTLAGSIFIPTVGVGNVSTGFNDEKLNEEMLKFHYAISPMNNTKLDNDSFSDVMPYKNMQLSMDEIGAASSDGKYYELEKLDIATLEIDCGRKADGYKIADFITGDGMPGISFSTSVSSAGMTSLTAVFDIKGELPGTDKGYYIYLFDNSGNQIPLEKRIDEDDKPYYLVKGQDPTSASDEVTASKDDGTDLDYGTVANNKKVSFAIRGLKQGTVYQVQLKAKNSKDVMQYLFDYTKETGAVKYQMTTSNNVIIEAGAMTFVYNEYNNKYGSMTYGIEGSEGTGMRIFYRVYDAADKEVECGKQNKTDLGYMLVPKGNNVKYYHSDKTQCNPLTVDFNPGSLNMGATYKVVFEAYLSTNEGVIIDKDHSIGTCTTTFKTPSVLNEPLSTLRVKAGSDTLQITGTMTDSQRVIIGDKFIIQVFDLQGNLFSTNPDKIEVNLASGQSKAAISGTFRDLTPNMAYIVKLTAETDTDNDGVKDFIYENSLAANTVSTASATISTNYTVNDELIISMEDITNFDDVVKVQYTIDSDDGSVNYTNGTTNLSEWTLSASGTYSYITNYKLESGKYFYTLQYYSSSGKLLGSNTGRFNK